MRDRSAVDTIKGYFYQFDYAIHKLLKQTDENNLVTIEGIEDVDIETATETTAIQCKYYANQEYNHSLIGKPIRFMLSHFIDLKLAGKPTIKYLLFGHYKTGQNKLIVPFDIDFLKNHFLTYTEKKVSHVFHSENSINDSDLTEFLNLLTVDIHAKDYDIQFNEILTEIQNVLSCDKFEAEFYFYNTALNEIRILAKEPDISKRKISKKQFLQNINKREILFNKWFLALIGRKEYLKELKDKYFRSLNKSPFERFFLIDLQTPYDKAELKEIILLISKKYSNLKKNEPKTFCAYILINNIAEIELINLKKDLQHEEFVFIDGFDFKGADFSSISITKTADYNNKIQIKFVNDCSNLDEIFVLNNRKTKEIYQFYFNTVFYLTKLTSVKQVNIQITKLSEIKEII
jgi:hypothetical protein